MTKPANLEYAFPLTAVTSDLDGQTFAFVAYRVVGTPFDGVMNYWSMETTLTPGQDIWSSPSDGDGSIGQYVIFGWRSGHPIPAWQSEANVTADIGWNPFDPANHKPTTVRYWELQPGSDVMATTLGVLPKVGVSGGGRHQYAGLVTYDGVGPSSLDVGDGGWYLLDPTMQITYPEIANATPKTTPGAAIAVYYTGPDGPYDPPLAFPAGWTPGNTTGSGPVLPKVDVLGSSSGLYGGLVNISGGLVSAPWYLQQSDTPVTAAGTQGTTSGPEYYGGDVAPAGTYVAWYESAGDDPAPTALPPGWTFRPYGLGPVAITDQNAGGVIGDIAYVVSGYVYNATEVWAPTIPDYVGTLADGNHVLEVGNVFFLPAYNSFRVCTVAGTLTVTSGGFGGSPDGFEMVFWDTTWDYAWPFLERYNLKTKTWLPRIPLPEVATTIPGTPAVPGQTAIVVNPLGEWVEGTISYQQYDSITHAGVTYYAVNGGGTLVGQWSQSFMDAAWSTVDPSRPHIDAIPEGPSSPGPAKPYAAEGGFAGVINGKLYFGGGDGQYITGTEFFVFDPATEEFTRLPDTPGLLDYGAFGVVQGKLRIFTTDLTDGASFDLATGVWSAFTATTTLSSAEQPGDQIQGVEIGGKLYFAYDKVYVFDPVALTVEAPAEGVSLGDLNISRMPFFVYPSGSGLGVFENGLTAHYDLTSGNWAAGADVPSAVRVSYPAGGVYRGVPYILSGLIDEGLVHPTSPGQHLAGVYGLTGNAPTYQAPPVKKLNKLGFSPRLSCALQSEAGSDSLEELLRAGMSPRQAKTWLRGDHSMKALLRGGFTRNQAKLLKEI